MGQADQFEFKKKIIKISLLTMLQEGIRKL